MSSGSADRPIPAQEGHSYGLRCVLNGHDARLLQIGGGGRVRVEVSRVERWCKPPAVAWSVYETEYGQTYPSRELAEQAAKNLSR